MTLDAYLLIAGALILGVAIGSDSRRMFWRGCAYAVAWPLVIVALWLIALCYALYAAYDAARKVFK